MRNVQAGDIVTCKGTRHDYRKVLRAEAWGKKKTQVIIIESGIMGGDYSVRPSDILRVYREVKRV